MTYQILISAFINKAKEVVHFIIPRCEEGVLVAELRCKAVVERIRSLDAHHHMAAHYLGKDSDSGS